MELHGVLVVDKPPRLTSAAVVARVRRALGVEAIGHTGTLDPMATGVLPLVLGDGTKIAQFLLADDKAYDGELELGRTTDTLDADGKELARADAAHVTREALAAAFAALTGDLQQIPPMHAAIKQDGRKLYELARAGVEVERAPRPVRVDAFELISFTPPRAAFRVACSKGTYVRALVRDVGEALGCGATLTALRRTRAGRYTLAEALAPDALTREAAAAAIVSPADALAHLTAWPVDEAGAARVGQGQRLPAPAGVAPGDRLRLLAPDGQLIAVCEVRPDGGVSYLRVLPWRR